MDEIPRKIWLQWYGDEDDGIGHDSPDGATWSTDKIYPTDICFIRSGKTNVLDIERDEWRTRAEAAEDDLRELRENTLLALGLNPVDVATGMEDQSIAYLLGGLKERVAELEARLAELGVTPPPPAATEQPR